MKKLIVLSVIFALVAGSAFAADVGAEVFGKAELLNGTTKEEADTAGAWSTPDPTTAYGMPRIRLGASGATEDGTIGGWLRYDGGWGNFGSSGFVWWKPFEWLKVQIGSNPDGEFGLGGIPDWGFHALACEVLGGLSDHIWGGGYTGIDVKFRDAFYGGYSSGGVILNINYADLAVNIGLPLAWGTVKNDYAKLTAQAKYNIGGVGTIGLTFVSDVNEAAAVDATTGDLTGFNDTAQVFVFFSLSAIENIGIDLGIGYKFSDSENVSAPGVTNTINNPLAVSLGFDGKFSDTFELKARVLGEFIGSSKTEVGGTTTEYSDGIAVLFDILPVIGINDNVKLYISAGIGLASGAESPDPADPTKKIAADAAFAWHVEPYISISPSYWSGAFFFGIRAESPIDKYTKSADPTAKPDTSYIKWSVPIGITTSF